MDKVLIIVRGLPGSGKSTFVELLGNVQVCTADDYHMVGDKYDWKPENAGLAHLKCQEKCENLMKSGAPKIAVANTSTTFSEMIPYYSLSSKYGYRVFSIIVENRHGGVNVHNVPDTTLQKMKNRFDVKL